MFQSAVGKTQRDVHKIQWQSSHKQARDTDVVSHPSYGNQALLRKVRGMSPHLSLRPSQGLILQRKCACGKNSTTGGECEECKAKKQLGMQTKLAINEPGDRYEQEADRVAEQVLATQTHQAVGHAPMRIQRHLGQASGSTDAVPDSVGKVLSSSGKPLEPALRQDMEQRFGYDFSSVRIRADADAGQSAKDVNAHAYTVGHNIVFGQGLYAPTSHEGQRLIAHELSHVLQQSASAAPALQREIEPTSSLDDTDTDDPMGDYETGADNEVAPDEDAVTNEEAPFFAEAGEESQAEPLTEYGDASQAEPLNGGSNNKPSSGKSILVKLPRTLIRFEGSKNIGAWGISGGKPGHGTPKGSFKIFWRDLTHTSNSYGTCDGKKIGPDGESKCKKKGGTYVGADMHYFQQFTVAGKSKIGFHRGDPNVQSHGCIHVNSGNAKTLWDWSSEGTPVLVK